MERAVCPGQSQGGRGAAAAAVQKVSSVITSAVFPEKPAAASTPSGFGLNPESDARCTGMARAEVFVVKLTTERNNWRG